MLKFYVDVAKKETIKMELFADFVSQWTVSVSQRLARFASEPFSKWKNPSLEAFQCIPNNRYTK